MEKQIEGVAEQIIAEDEERRKQDLVRASGTIQSHRLLQRIIIVQDLFNIAPKRPNWDLKRDMEKKLAKLERKTAESIHTLIRTSYPVWPR